MNHALLSMEKSSFGRSFNCASKSRIKRNILKLKGPLLRNWMKIISFSAFTVPCLFQYSKSSVSACQNHFPMNHDLLSMEKSSFGRSFNCASKSRIKKSILQLKGPLFRNWMKIVSFSAFAAPCCFQFSNLRFSYSNTNISRFFFHIQQHHWNHVINPRCRISMDSWVEALTLLFSVLNNVIEIM